MKEPHEVTADDLARDLLSFLRKRILAEQVDFTIDTPLEEVGIDSVSLLELLLYLERQHGIFIADEQLTPEHISTIRTLARTAFAGGSGA